MSKDSIVIFHDTNMSSEDISQSTPDIPAMLERALSTQEDLDMHVEDGESQTILKRQFPVVTDNQHDKDICLVTGCKFGRSEAAESIQCIICNIWYHSQCVDVYPNQITFSCLE